MHGHVIRNHEWKLVRPWGGRDFIATDAWELYHISEDISESNNVIEQYPEIAAQLRTAWESWSASLMPAQWGWQPDLCGSYKVD